MNKEDIRLSAAISAAQRGGRRLRRSLELDRPTIDAGIAAGDDATEDQVRALDAFVQRYQQVYDLIAHRLYPAIYRSASLGERPPALRSLMVWLEEQAVIDGARLWLARAELRNRLVHEYPLEDEERAAALIAALSEADAMLAQLAAALAYIESARLFAETGVSTS